MGYNDDMSKRIKTSMRDIVDSLVRHYGEKNRRIIKNKIKNIYFDFTSNPIEEYNYANNHRSEIGVYKYLEIKRNYINYTKNYERSKKIAIEKLKKITNDLYPFESYDLVNDNEELFLETFYEGKINYIHPKYDALLVSDIVSNDIKAKIKQNRQAFEEAASIMKINISSLLENLDEFFAERENIEKKLKIDVVKRCMHCKQMKDEIADKVGQDVGWELVSILTFADGPCSGEAIYNIESDDVNLKYIKVPIATMLNNNRIDLDVAFVRELICSLESNGIHNGISVLDDEKRNVVANSIRVQELACSVVDELHGKNIFIFDNEKYNKTRGTSKVEAIYPIVKKFFDEYEVIINDCALNNESIMIESCFGKEWNDYSNLIDRILENLEKNGTDNFCFDEMICNKIDELERQMIEHYNLISKLKKKKK